MPVSWTLLELTFRVAVVATVVNIPLALAVSWLLVKTRVPGRLIVDVLVSLPLAVPPIAIGFFLLLLLGREGPIGGLAHVLSGGGHRVHVVCGSGSLGGGVVSAHGAGDDGCDGGSGRAARNVRAEPRGRPLEGVLTITVPLASRGILAGVLLGFVRAISEFGATITVAGNIAGKTQTLPLALYSAVILRDDTQALLLTAIAIAIAAATLVVHNWLLSKTPRPEVS